MYVIDHYGQIVIVDTDTIHSAPQYIKKKVFMDKHIDTFLLHLNNEIWEDGANCDNVDEKYSSFY